MSRGFGVMQRAIIEAALPAMAAGQDAVSRRRSSCWGLSVDFHDTSRLRSSAYGFLFDLPANVIDLRAVLRFLALREQKTHGEYEYVDNAFQGSFSRAVRTLVQRGVLVPVDEWVTCEQVRPSSGVTQWDRFIAPNRIRLGGDRRVRFVRLVSNFETATTSG